MASNKHTPFLLIASNVVPKACGLLCFLFRVIFAFSGFVFFCRFLFRTIVVSLLHCSVSSFFHCIALTTKENVKSFSC